MRIGLNLLFMVPGQVGGTETLSRELIAELAKARPDDEFIVYCGAEAAAVLPDPAWPANVEIRATRVRCANKPLRILHELFALPLRARRDGVDLMHSLGVTTPLWGCGVRVVSIHDLIFHHHPSTFSPLAQRALEFLVPRGAKRAARVQTLSEFSKSDLVATYGIEADKIDVVQPGSGLEPRASTLERAELAREVAIGEGEFALCVASGHEHKNLGRLFEAWTSVSGDVRLVVTGRAGTADAALKKRVADLGLGDRVSFSGWVSDNVLEALYAHAAMFVYPSQREGFGLPVLEAMARGVPVACSNASSLPEVAGDAALLFDPTDVGSIANAVERAIGDVELREALKAAGRARAAEFSWQRTARETIESYARAGVQV